MMELDSQWMQLFREQVRNWFAKNRRDLPWRGARDPYEIWISEIMLQQTTTATVQGYYTRFLERFPNVSVLAKAELSEVFRLWEGLGYYRRAALLHKAARWIREHNGGVFPRTYELVLALPGIGRYTAGAILSIAFDQRLPILEANTIRLHSRILALQSDPKQSESNRILWNFAEEILPRRGGIGCFNQALMDLGAMICTPQNPLCERRCPISGLCRSAQLGLQHQIPVPAPRKDWEEITETAVLIRKRGKILMIRYPEGVRWAGLWDFPRVGGRNDAEILENLRKILGRNIVLQEEISKRKHSVTRFKINLIFREARETEREKKRQSIPGPYETRWFSMRELSELPMNSTGRDMIGDIPKGNSRK